MKKETVIICISLLLSCQQSPIKDTTILCSTSEAEEITTNSAVLNGAVMTSDAKSDKVDVWFLISKDAASLSSTGNRVTAGTVSSKGGSFSSIATNLEQETTYYYRAFASIDGKVASGDVIAFTTMARPIEVIITGDAIDVSFFSASLCGYANLKEAGQFDSFGIIYSTNTNPSTENGTIKNAKEIDRDNQYCISVDGLESGKDYYYKAFLKVGSILRVGEVKCFSTPLLQVSITTLPATIIDHHTAVLNAALETNIDQYNVDYKLGFYYIGESDDKDKFVEASKNSNENTISATINNLKPDNTYYYMAGLTLFDKFYTGDFLSIKTPEDPDKYKSPITIDGNFSDWNKLDASKIATAYSNPDAYYTALNTVKVYADEFYVFVYFEWDTNQTNPEPNEEYVPFHMYINRDGNAASGGFSDYFSDACSDLLLEGLIYPDGRTIGPFYPCLVSEWIGEVNGSGWQWGWDGLLYEYYSDDDICKGAGVEGKYELLISRAKMDALHIPIADNFSIGFEIEKAWNAVGLLPNDAKTSNNPYGISPSLKVIAAK